MTIVTVILASVDVDRDAASADNDDDDRDDAERVTQHKPNARSSGSSAGCPPVSGVQINIVCVAVVRIRI